MFEKVGSREQQDNTTASDNFLPDIPPLSHYFTFQQDNSPVHRARDTVEMLTKEAPDFISPTFWPPNSSALNLVDYKIWSVMQKKVYKHHVKDISELQECIVATWDELDQRIIDTAVGQWRIRLCACVKALGGHFKHKLYFCIT